MSERVLVTGGLGFIGSFVVDELVARGHKPTVLDNLTGHVVEPDDSPAWEVHTGSVRSLGYHLHGYDRIIHAAAPVGAVGILSHEEVVYRIVADTRRVARLANDAGIPLVNISSSEVYGFTGRYTELDDCIIPARFNRRISYALGKLAAEHVVEEERTRGLRARSIRPFNVIGPRQSKAKGFVLPTFIEQVHQGEALTIFGTGQQRRAFTDVRDLVSFILDHAHDGPPVNVGVPGNEATINQLAAMVASLSGKPRHPYHYTTGKDVHGPDYEEAAGVSKLPDNRAALALGWEPVHGLEDIVRHAIRDYQEADHGQD